jgi:hypothetical protein
MEPTDQGTEERYVRCRRCHGVFEAGLPNCTRCGTPYVAPAVETAALPDSYAQKYQGSEFAEPEVVAPLLAPARRRPGMTLVMGMGAVLLVLAVALGAMVALGAFDGGPAPTSPPIYVAAHTPQPTPSPTLPPSIARTMSVLADPMLNLHVSVRTSLTMSAKARGGGDSMQQIINSEIACAGGNESGTWQSGSTNTEWRLVDGTYYFRNLPSTKWQTRATFPPFLITSPIFNITEARQLQYLGSEEKFGIQTDKLETTRFWGPDMSKLSFLDVATLTMKPDQRSMQMWVAANGLPVYAVFHAWRDSADGTSTRLVDISTVYTFSTLGGVAPIPSPTMK